MYFRITELNKMKIKHVVLTTSFLLGAAVVTGDAHVAQAHIALVSVKDGRTVVEHQYRNGPNLAMAAPMQRHDFCCGPASYGIPALYAPAWGYRVRSSYYELGTFHHSNLRRTAVLVPWLGYVGAYERRGYYDNGIFHHSNARRTLVFVR